MRDYPRERVTGHLTAGVSDFLSTGHDEHGGPGRAGERLQAGLAEPQATRRQGRNEEARHQLHDRLSAARVSRQSDRWTLTWHGCAVRCRCRSLPAGERCAHTSPATHQPSPENSRDFPCARRGRLAGLASWSSRRAGRVADVRSPLQVCKDRPPIALRPPRARSHPFPSPSPRQLTSTRSPHAGTRAWSRAADAIGQGERAR